MADRSHDLIELLTKRTKRNTRFGYGIRTADEHVRAAVECVDDKACAACKGLQGAAFNRSAMVKEASTRLTYSNEDMTFGPPRTSSHDIAAFCKSLGVQSPNRTLMVFQNVVTTPRRDRDGDVLRTEGAEVDPKMPLLWHHVLAMPVGKMLKIVGHNQKALTVASAIIDSELGNDCAQLIDFGALRISHGFRPLEFEPLAQKDYGGAQQPGFDVRRFEVMEESLVTVPSNPDAEITLFSRGKLHDPLVKAHAKSVFEARKKSMPAASIPKMQGPKMPVDEEEEQESSEKPEGECDKSKVSANTMPAASTKVGRVLSGENERRLRTAMGEIMSILGSLEPAVSTPESNEQCPTCASASLVVAKSVLNAKESDRQELLTIRDLVSKSLEGLDRARMHRALGID